MIRALFTVLVVLLGLTPAHAKFQHPKTFVFCPMGALSSYYGPTDHVPVPDPCLSAPQPGTTGDTGGFQLTGCWTAGGASTLNQYTGTTTNYGAANSSPLTVATPFHTPGCEYPIANYTPISGLTDPLSGGVSIIPDCTYSASGTAYITGVPGQMNCVPNITHAVNGVWSLKGYNFGAVGGHGCIPVIINSISGALTEIDVINNNFTNDSGNCATWVFNPTMLYIGNVLPGVGKAIKIISNRFDGNASVWGLANGSCPNINQVCNPWEAFLTNGGNTTIKYNLFKDWTGRTIATVSNTNDNLTMVGNMFLGGDSRLPTHGEFNQPFLAGFPANDQVNAFNNFIMTTLHMNNWDSLLLTMYVAIQTNTYSWNHVTADHNVLLYANAGGSDQTATLTGCSIAANTSQMSCTGVAGGRVGTGQTSASGKNCGGASGIAFTLGRLISAGGVQGTDWGSAGPGGGFWVQNGTSVWDLDANTDAVSYLDTGYIDDNSTPGSYSGRAGNTVTITAASLVNIIPNSVTWLTGTGITGTPIVTAYIPPATGGIGQYTINGPALAVPPTSIKVNPNPAVGGQWSVSSAITCVTPQTFQHFAPIGINWHMRYYFNHGTQMTNNLIDSAVPGAGVAPYWDVQVNAAPPACTANDMVGNDGVDGFTIFGTQNFDISHTLTNINRWNIPSHIANLCGP